MKKNIETELAEANAKVASLEGKLTEARVRKEQSAASVEQALRVFDAEGTIPASKAVAEARDADATAGEFVLRGERLLVAARAEADAAKRSVLEARRDELLVEFARTNLIARAQPAFEREAKALLAVVAAREELVELASNFQMKSNELRAILTELGDGDVEVAPGIKRPRFQHDPSGDILAHDGLVPTLTAAIPRTTSKTARRYVQHLIDTRFRG